MAGAAGRPLEAALLGRDLARVWPSDDCDLQIARGYGLMRDRNGPRGRDILARYRGSLMAELFGSPAVLERARRRPEASRAPLPEACAKNQTNSKKIPGNNDLSFEQTGD